jgi:hypothetical protein
LRRSMRLGWGVRAREPQGGGEPVWLVPRLLTGVRAASPFCEGGV